MFAKNALCLACKRNVVSPLHRNSRNQYLHALPALNSPRRKDFFSSNALLAQKQLGKNDGLSDSPDSQKQRRRGGRGPAAPTSLRRVAVEAQRSKDGFISKAQLKEQGIYHARVLIFLDILCCDGRRCVTVLILGRDRLGCHCLRCCRKIRYSQSSRNSSR